MPARIFPLVLPTPLLQIPSSPMTVPFGCLHRDALTAAPGSFPKRSCAYSSRESLGVFPDERLFWWPQMLPSNVPATLHPPTMRRPSLKQFFLFSFLFSFAGDREDPSPFYTATNLFFTHGLPDGPRRRRQRQTYLKRRALFVASRWGPPPFVFDLAVRAP